MIRLKVMMPTHVVLQTQALSVNVDALGGARGFLPHHIDFACNLQSGIISYIDEDKQEGFVALDGGVLVKKGQNLFISTPDAVASSHLADLEDFIARKAEEDRKLERSSRGTVARLEVALVRRMMELQGT